MEDFQLDIVVGKGPAASSIRLTLPPFTLIGATTRTGHDHRAAARPVRARGPPRLLRHGRARRRSCVERRGSSAVTIDEPASWEIARRSRGTPRIANRLLRRVRDFAQVRGDGTIDATTARTGCSVFGVDDLGLDKVDRRSSARCAGSSVAAPSGCRRWPSPSASRPRRSRTSTSRSSSSAASWPVRHAGGWRCRPPTSTSASSPSAIAPPPDTPASSTESMASLAPKTPLLGLGRARPAWALTLTAPRTLGNFFD